MTNEIEKFKLKIRNTERLKRKHIQFSLTEAKDLDKEIKALQNRIDKLEVSVLQKKTLTVEIVGREF